MRHMSVPREALPAKLVIGLLYSNPERLREVLDALSVRFGPVDFLSGPGPFTYTSYYEPEMGKGLYRRTASFLQLVAPDALPDIKLFTNELEARLSVEGNRQFNIDPGLLSEERLVLATGKNYTHRIYLGDGIFADLTLIYQKGSFRALPWTYPDYREPLLLHFLAALRQKLMYQRTGRIPSRDMRPKGVIS